MEYKAIMSSLKKKEFFPVYFLHGEEPFYIDEITKYIETHALDEAERDFNLMVLYGKDVDFKIVLDNVRRYPVMAARQVVILREAQEMKTLEQLTPFFEKPVESTIFVLAHKHKTMDKRKKFGKALLQSEKEGKACVFESSKLYDNQLPTWIETYLRDRKTPIEPDATQLLAESLGNDLAKISNELDKLLINLEAGKSITKDIIQKNIGISKDFNVFELQAALARKDAAKANLIVNYFISNPKNNPLPMIISALYGYFSKVYICKSLPNPTDDSIATALGINRFFAKDYKTAAAAFNRPQLEQIIHWLKEYDLQSKGVYLGLPTDEFNTHIEHGELLREMIWKMLH